MNYPKELDEYSNEEIDTENRRRVQCQIKDLCHYCGKNLESGSPCKIHPHDGSSQE